MNIDNALAAILAANVNENIKNTQDDMSLDECCKEFYILYKKLCNAGFSEDQSLTLLLGIIGSAAND
nr:MAG TPA: Protein of unknown function (DUF1640) [Bacteriophage sp.]